MFELDHVLKQFKTLPPDGAGSQLEKDSTYGGLTQENEAIDQTDDLLSSPGNFGLSPSQRKGILYKKLRATCRLVLTDVSIKTFTENWVSKQSFFILILTMA